MKRKRRRLISKLKAVRADDVVFATLIHNESVKVVAGSGVVLLKSMETGKPYPTPAGLKIPYQAYGEVFDAVIRDITDEVVLERGVDDIYEEELNDKDNQDVMPVDRWDDILTLMDELKLESITGALSNLFSTVAGAALVGVSLWLSTTDFFLKMLCYALAIVGFLVSTRALYKFVTKFCSADSKVIMDRDGRYINLDTGKTNLNRGMKLPIKERQVK